MTGLFRHFVIIYTKCTDLCDQIDQRDLSHKGLIFKMRSIISLFKNSIISKKNLPASSMGLFWIDAVSCGDIRLGKNSSIFLRASWILLQRQNSVR